jgi:hypothetical protein
MDDIRLLLHTLPASRAPEFTPFFGGIRVAPLIRFCAVLLQKCMCLSVPSSVLWDPLLHKAQVNVTRCRIGHARFTLF